MNEVDIINEKHGVYKGYEYIVFYFERGIMGHFNAYVKIPPNNPEYSKGMKQRWFKFGGSKRHYYRDYDGVDLEVHGGLTFAKLIHKRSIKYYPQPFTLGFWVGWDYLHAGDEMFLPEDRISDKPTVIQHSYKQLMKNWEKGMDKLPEYMKDRRATWEQVERDCRDAIRQLIAK